MTALSDQADRDVLRQLTEAYVRIAGLPVQAERRALWRGHYALQSAGRIPIVLHFGMWNQWCREMFDGAALQCRDPFFRQHEQWLRMQLFQHSTGDDSIQEPWITQCATLRVDAANLWGLPLSRHEAEVPGGASQIIPPLTDWADLDRLRMPHHSVDEEATRRDVTRLQEAVGDLIPVNVEYGCGYMNFYADISWGLAQLRGLEQMMMDLYESPAEMHRLCAFLRDAALTAQDEAEQAGHFSLTTQLNQAMPYCTGHEDPQPNAARPRSALWCFCASQEFTLVSPEMHDEFLLRYQLPILRNWGLIAYGRCENLTNKISLLRKIPNLRQIAVTPVADIAACAGQIGTDYAISWRPNPADMICLGFDEARARRLVREGLDKLKGCHVHINLKDIETLEGDPSRLARWVTLARKETER